MTTTQVRPSRRALVHGAAWSVPVVTVAAAAPAFAASPCVTDQDLTLDWGTTTYAKNNENLGTASVTGGAGVTPVTVSFASAKNGTGVRAASNLTVTSQTNVGGQGTGQKALELFHSQPSTTGRANRQDVTITFDRPVTGLSFTISDIDSLDSNGNDNDYVDYVELTGVYSAQKAAGLLGAGTVADPWRMQNTNNSIDTTSSAGNVRVTYSGPVTSITLSFYNGAHNNAKGQHAIYLNDFTFTAKGC